MLTYLLWGLRGLSILTGTLLVLFTLSAALRSFVLPRNEVVRISVTIFSAVRLVFDLLAKLVRTYARRDRLMAHYAPVALVALPIGWLTLVSLGYTLLYWGCDAGPLRRCFELSGSSLLTLGTRNVWGTPVNMLTYSEATIGLLLITLLLSYLPTIYQAFSRREVVVARLELRAGPERSAAGLLRWLNSSGPLAGPSLRDDEGEWAAWEQWFVELEESHTSLPVLNFFRSPQPGRSWVLSAHLILNAANLAFSAVALPHTRQMELTFAAGCLAVNRLHRFFDEQAGAEPGELLPTQQPHDSPSRADFDRACQQLAEAGLSLRPDAAAAWAAYTERRRRYAPAVLFLAELIMAPEIKAI